MKLKKKVLNWLLKNAENADLNIIVIEPKSVDFTNFLNDKDIKKSNFSYQ